MAKRTTYTVSKVKSGGWEAKESGAGIIERRDLPKTSRERLQRAKSLLEMGRMRSAR